MAELARSTMDFFAAQAAAKRRTAVLVIVFVLAVALTVALADVGVTIAVQMAYGREDSSFRQVFLSLVAPVGLVVCAIVAIGVAWHRSQLGADGGDAVASMLGGVPVDRSTADPAERRAVNVLEEMSIAAALPVPRLYVLPGEPTINAFAAGDSPERAVVAVSRGALDALSRDELQGVLAHELSHVLNHDTRLNMKLIAYVGGLTGLALLGRVLLQFGRPARSSRSRDRDDDKLGAAIMLAGLALLVAGAIGAFAGRLLRLAVSRQREFLADAAAVQFTRNPGGLSGALSRIAERGSALSSPHAPEAAHFFFANGVSGFVAGLFSTHPPLDERIRRLQAVPLAGAPLAAPAAQPRPPAAAAQPRPLAPAGAALAPGLAAPPTGSGAADLAAAATAAVGRLAPEHLARATAALAAFPAALVDAAREPSGARALVLALLLDGDDRAVRGRQLAAIGDPALAREADRLAAALEPIAQQERLGLVDLALPTLDRLSEGQARALVETLRSLAAADGRVTLYEWALQRVVRRRLGPRLGAPRPARVRSLAEVQAEAQELLSALAWVGQRDPAAAQRALDAAARAVPVGVEWRLVPRDGLGPARLDAVLSRLDEVAPPQKAQLLGAATACVLADGRVTASESHLLRAVAASLGLPMPGLPASAAAPAASAA